MLRRITGGFWKKRGEDSMTVEEIFEQTTKQEVFDKSMEYWNSGKTKEWLELKIDLVIGKREGYYFWDMDGKKLMDVHINGGTYSLGHRNPEVINALIEATKYVDIGNHHFPSPLKAKLAETVVKASTEGMKHVIYGSSGGEVVDLAIKCARAATGRKKVISVENCYHGHTGLAVAAGADRYCHLFHAERPEFVKVPFNDVSAMEEALKEGDAACVIMETIPATYGFPPVVPLTREISDSLLRKTFRTTCWPLPGFPFYLISSLDSSPCYKSDISHFT